jgi:hypothetical protein
MVVASIGFAWLMQVFICLIQPSRPRFYSHSSDEKGLVEACISYRRMDDFNFVRNNRDQTTV